MGWVSLRNRQPHRYPASAHLPGRRRRLHYSVARWGSDLQRLFAGFFEFRDGFAKPVRFAVLILVPILLSYLITNQDRVSQTATKEQVVVIVALSLGFLMLAPREGDAMAGMSEQVGLKGTAT